MVATAPDALAKVHEAIDYLRAAGRADEAAAVEALLPVAKPRRLPPTPPAGEQDLVPIAEAAERLGLSRNAIQRRIDSGLLEGARNERNGYRFVTQASLDRLLELGRMQEAIMAFPYYLDAGPIDPDSLLGQMLRAAEEEDEADGEEGLLAPSDGERARA